MVLVVAVVVVVLVVVVVGAGHNILVVPAWKKGENFNFSLVISTQSLTFFMIALTLILVAWFQI